MSRFHFLNILFKGNPTILQIYGGLILFLIRDYFIIFSHAFIISLLKDEESFSYREQN